MSSCKKCKKCKECKDKEPRDEKYQHYIHDREQILEILTRYQRLLVDKEKIFDWSPDGGPSNSMDGWVIDHLHRIVEYYESLLEAHTMFDQATRYAMFEPIKRWKREMLHEDYPKENKDEA